MEIEKIKVLARDGYPLAATLFRPEGESKGIIQFHSGTGIPQDVYKNYAIYLAEAGFTVVTFDYRGVAASAPNNLKGFQASLQDWGKLDISGVFDWISSTFPEQKKIIFAHSLGGQLVGFIDRHKEIDAVFMVASGTGYWKDVTSHRKWYFALLWYVLIPIHTMLFGFANLNKVGQGANLPKGIALQLRRWCTSHEYFEPELDKELSPVYFDKITTPFYTLQFDDDPLTNRTTAKKLLDFYTNAKIKTRIVKPEEFGVDKIGHAGFFSRKFKGTLWSDTLQKIEGAV